MRFGDSPQPAPYLNVKDQRRLLGMVGTLSLVVVSIIWAGRAESWYWLIPADNETAQNETAQNETAQSRESAPEASVAGASDSNSDSPQRTAKPLVIAQAPEPDDADSSATSETEDSTAQTDPVPGEPQLFSEPTSVSTLPRDWFEQVANNQLGIRSEEAAAYYRILAHIKRLDDRLLEDSARDDVLHVNLIRDAEQYQGVLLKVQGIARRIMPIPVNSNEFGVETLYEVWFTTADAENDPWRVVTSDVDSRLPTGEQVMAPVTVTGYFFKQYGYAAEGGLRVAPLLLAARLEPVVLKKVIPDSSALEPYIIGLAAVVGGLTVLAIFFYNRGDSRFKRRMARQFPLPDQKTNPVLDELEQSPPKPGPFEA